MITRNSLDTKTKKNEEKSARLKTLKDNLDKNKTKNVKEK